MIKKYFNNYIDEVYQDNLFFQKFHHIKPSETLHQFEEIQYDELCEEWKIEYKKQLLSINSSLDNFKQLVNVIRKKKVVPFIGSGLSASSGYETWTNFLITLANEANELEAVEQLLNDNLYEEASEYLMEKLGKENFNSKVDLKFGSPVGKIQGMINDIPKATNGTIITTNFDKLVETVFQNNGIRLDIIHGNEDKEFHRGFVSGDNYLLKLHGSINDTKSRVFTKTEYEEAYLLDGKIDFNKPLPENLSKIYLNSTLLFLGCSLENDRTLQLFKKVKEQYEERKIPRHFTIISAPKTKEKLVEREKFLTEHMIFPIWYPYQEYDKLNEIFELLLYEIENE
ncbi:MAG: SIR2 family protein [Sulfurimonas sp.]|jgi:NAD-dependent SIR2 family protein deacetylase